MNKLQIVFLLSSPSPSKYFDAFLGLHDCVADAGFHTSVATQPAQLCRPSERPRIAVLDGNYVASHLDTFRMLRNIREQSDVRGIVFVTDKYHHGQAREAGADVCLSSKVDCAQLRTVLTKLASRCLATPISSP